MRKIYFIGNVKAEFASRWKREFSPESVARGKATAKTKALNKKGITTPVTSLTAERYKGGISKSQEIAAQGKKAMLTKAASSNRTMKPTKQRGLLKAPSAQNQLSSKSAQKFKQGAQNQATNRTNAFKAKREDLANKVTGQGKYKPQLTTPTLNPFEQSSWEKNASKGIKSQPPKVKVNSIPVKKSNLLSKIGGAIKRNPVASGAALGAGVGALGYGAYKKMKNKDKR